MYNALAKHFRDSLELPQEYLDGHIKDLEFLARYKYDDYELYTPASRFFVHLYAWLRQFNKPEERQAALDFVRHSLIFVSQREMQDLARFLYYDLIVPEILRQIILIERLDRFDYARAFKDHFARYLRGCLFIGLSDGAKIDFFRRHHKELSQEQVIPYYKADDEHCIESLRRDLRDPTANFWAVFLIDDFTASGRTLVRNDTGDPDGALVRASKKHAHVLSSAQRIYLCHYIATEAAHRHVTELCLSIDPYRSKLSCMTALPLPESVRLTPETVGSDELRKQICALTESYYDPSFEDENTKAGGGIKYGYGHRGLPVVLYSNTPNNSLFILWLDSAMRSTSTRRFHALFRRMDRHKAK